MAQFFEFDPAKAGINLRKHRVSFEEAQTVFADGRAIDLFDAEHSPREDRFVRIGLSRSGRLLVVIYTEQLTQDDSIIRIISARIASSAEARAYLGEP